MIKNTADQNVAFQMIAIADGSAVTTGTPAVYVTGDAGTQAAGSGAKVHEGNGCWSYVVSAADSNYDHVSFTMVLANAVNQTVNVYPVVQADYKADVDSQLAAIKAETALIVADTNELQSDDVPTLISTLDAVVDTVKAETALIVVDTADIQSRIPDALVSGNLKADVIAISGSTDAADNLEASAKTIIVATASGTPTTTTMVSDLTEVTDDHYNGRIIIWTSGVLQNQATDITDYAGATKTLTFTTVTEAASSSDTFVIV